MSYYLFLDCETGGIGLDKSLLELGLIVTNEKMEPMSSNIWYIKPDDGIYRVTAEALSINRIDLVEHDKRAKKYREVGTELYTWLDCTYKAIQSKLIPAGKNVMGDVAQVCDKLMSRGTWESYVSYQPLEINGAWRLLELQNKVPRLNKTSMSDLANHFNIPIENLHTSQGDNLLGMEIMKRLVQL